MRRMNDKVTLLAAALAIGCSQTADSKSHEARPAPVRPAGGKLANSVEAALAKIAAGKPVTTKDTKAYGCSVKYGR